MASGERCRQGWTDCSGCLVLTPGAEEAETGKISSVLKHMLHSKKKKKLKPHTIFSFYSTTFYSHLAGLGRRGLC